MVRKSKGAQKLQDEFIMFIHDSDHLEIFAHLATLSVPEMITGVEALIPQAPIYGDGSVKDFVHFGLSFSQNHTRAKTVFTALNTLLREHHNASNASHQEKRRLVEVLGLNVAQEPLLDIVQEFRNDHAKLCSVIQEKYGLKLIVRSRSSKKEVQRRRLVEVADPDDPRALHVKEPEYLRIHPDESVVIISIPNDKSQEPSIELMILRDIPSDSDDKYSAPLRAWLYNVITTACNNRRDVRPYHPGKMTQIGLNMGPRHCRILGWAKSFTTKLDREAKISQDTDLIGAMSLLWAFVKSRVPRDITQPVQDILDGDFPQDTDEDFKDLKLQYPRLATQNVPEGAGFTINVDGKAYNFSTAERAPPEGIATKGYEAHTHIDPACCRWAFGWTVLREEPSTMKLPKNYGSNYVDVGLRVIVESATGTLSVFQPNHLHGTTFTGGAVNYGLSMTMTQRVRDGYLEMIKEGPRVFTSAPVDLHD